MTQDIHKINTAEATTRYTPGHLLAPFGWAADAVGAMVEAEPTLLFHLFELDRARMHLIALALAHLNEFSPNLGIFLVSGSVRAIIEKILGRNPTGLKRALAVREARITAPCCSRFAGQRRGAISRRYSASLRRKPSHGRAYARCDRARFSAA